MNREFYLDRVYEDDPRSDCYVDHLAWIDDLTLAELHEAYNEDCHCAAAGTRIAERIYELEKEK